jgi:hypothetical protein
MWPEAKKRKGVPGITKSDLLAINKVDLAPYVGAVPDHGNDLTSAGLTALFHDRSARFIYLFYYPLQLDGPPGIYRPHRRKIFLGSAFSVHLQKKHPTIFVCLGEIRFKLDSPIVMLEGPEVVWRPLHYQRISKIVVGFSEPRTIPKRLRKPCLCFSESFRIHGLNALVIKSHRLAAFFDLRHIASPSAACTSSGASGAWPSHPEARPDYQTEHK